MKDALGHTLVRCPFEWPIQYKEKIVLRSVVSYVHHFTLTMPSQQFFHLLNALNTLQRSDKFSAFQVINAQYKSSPDENSHIAVDILVPRILADTEISRPCPIIIRIHGGFLVCYLFQ